MIFHLLGVIREALRVDEFHAVLLGHLLEGAEMDEIFGTVDDGFEGEVVFCAEDGDDAFRRHVATFGPVDGSRHLDFEDVIAELVTRVGHFQSLHHLVRVGHRAWVRE